MRERPVLFSAPMVRAILTGTKTQTRRIAKPVRHPDLGNLYDPGALVLEHEPQHVIDRACPFGQPGDRLYVRETYRFTSDFDADSPARVAERCLDAGYRTPWAPLQYEVDGAKREWRHVGTPPHDEPPKPGKLRPSIHMPRWASRILLEITAVRVERLQSISEADARAEGAPGYEEGIDPPPPDGEHEWSYCASFRRLWQSINGPGSWDANPWVWVVEFKRVEAGASNRGELTC